MPIPQSSQSCQDLLKCGCKSNRKRFANASLPCTALCSIVQHCAIALGCATDNKQLNAGSQ